MSIILVRNAKKFLDRDFLFIEKGQVTLDYENKIRISKNLFSRMFELPGRFTADLRPREERKKIIYAGSDHRLQTTDYGLKTTN